MTAIKGESASEWVDLNDYDLGRCDKSRPISRYSGNKEGGVFRHRNCRDVSKRSAYSREGGEAPTRFKEDVTKEMINDYRRRLKN
ncbi:Uncharacterized protein ALO54_03056 [Pseudomonas syringae pv. philadelphi]|nr:Uncharacterized protein ALO54_03056 [Pseudomonas syringae pv. philadelphi]RMM16072.1 hypothetical protein ALQ83_02192 [Pseudomonas syringae pv. berberidis]RMP66385.1 hypothetical protein ALQ19_02149 [Pseudomonas syringae pv. berberidis]